jgi:hypothetical protein
MTGPRKYSHPSWSIAKRIAYYSDAVRPDGCTYWMGSLTERGYPSLRIGGKLKYVRRLILEDKLKRPIKPKHEACHSCGVRLCVSYNHIYEGTHQQNMQDRKHHDGWQASPRGVNHPAAKLDDATVRAIRRSKLKTVVAATAFGISQSHISRIRLRQSWAHVK